MPEPLTQKLDVNSVQVAALLTRIAALEETGRVHTAMFGDMAKRMNIIENNRTNSLLDKKEFSSIKEALGTDLRVAFDHIRELSQKVTILEERSTAKKGRPWDEETEAVFAYMKENRFKWTSYMLSQNMNLDPKVVSSKLNSLVRARRIVMEKEQGHHGLYFYDPDQDKGLTSENPSS